jgi:hypothetical protein
MPSLSSDEEFIEAWNELASPSLVAAKFGVSDRSVMQRRRSIESRYKIKLPTKNDLRLKGASTLFGADGEVKLQWIKTGQGQPSPEDWQDIVKDVFADSVPVKRIPPPKTCNRDLLTVYPIGDHHVAMYSWGEETGEDYDTRIAENLLVSAVSHLVDLSPPSEVAIIANVGDFFHVDQHRPETTRSRNTLDVDTRYAAMIHAGVAMLRTCIEHALTKHRMVKIINACGNHDDVGALWLSLALSLLYEKNPRVTIETSPAKFAYHQHGAVLLGVTHGDSAKLDKLGSVMAADQSGLWGVTRHRYWITGHIHQRKVLEQPGVLVESFRTLAARDAWATAAGYRSGRDMTSIVFHKEHGEVARHRFDVGMLESKK